VRKQPHPAPICSDFRVTYMSGTSPAPETLRSAVMRQGATGDRCHRGLRDGNTQRCRDENGDCCSRASGTLSATRMVVKTNDGLSLVVAQG
jgi:hypothetical protein